MHGLSYAIEIFVFPTLLPDLQLNKGRILMQSQMLMCVNPFLDQCCHSCLLGTNVVFIYCLFIVSLRVQVLIYLAPTFSIGENNCKHSCYLASFVMEMFPLSYVDIDFLFLK